MEYPLTLTQILKRAKRMSGGVGLIGKDSQGKIHSTSYAKSYKRICQLANALQKLGIRPGDRVGTFAWNSLEHFELYFAVPGIGAILHTLNIRLFPDQLTYIVQHAEDRILFVDVDGVPLVEKIAQNLSTVEKYIIMGAPAHFKTSLTPYQHYEELIASESSELDWPALDERQAAGLCYTSGTTGNPKGALYSHRSQFLHALGISAAETLGIRSTDTILVLVPMFHANAWGIPYAAALVGARLVLPGRHLKPADSAQMIQDFGVTIAAGVPTLWMGLLEELKKGKYKTDSLRALVAGGAAMPRALIQSFETELKIPVLHAWGMTELSPLGTCSGLLDTDRELEAEVRLSRKARQGSAAPCMEMRIVDESGVELEWDGEVYGELQVRGPWVISSYFKDTSGEVQFTPDGWFKTGDAASIDPTGSMMIVDRKKDLIKSGGEWISSIALENALMCHEKVQEAAVIGVPDKKWSERPVALVVLKKGAEVSVTELQLELLKLFEKFWIPEVFHFIAEIPKTSVGKFDKKRLRKDYAD